MYERILVPLDGSALSEGILSYLSQVAEGVHSKVTLLYVAGPGEGAVKKASIVRVPHGTKVTAGDYLREMEEAMRQKGLEVDSAVVEGRPAEAIVRYAAEQGYGLIAMATHGHSGPGRWVYGSTADKVLHTTDLPIFLLRPKGGDSSSEVRPLNHLVVPLDGSPLAEWVLPHAEQLATEMTLHIDLVRVIPTTTMALAEVDADNYSYDQRLDIYVQLAASDYLNEWSKELRSRGLQATSKLVRGHPASLIIDFAEETGESLILMSTHGRSGVGRWLLGSVADRVLRASHRPVLLIRPQAAKEAGGA